jgi:hypothetical protein
MRVIVEFGAQSGRAAVLGECSVRAPTGMSGVFVKSMDAKEYLPSVPRICGHASGDRTATASGVECASTITSVRAACEWLEAEMLCVAHRLVTRTSRSISGVERVVVFNVILLS